MITRIKKRFSLTNDTAKGEAVMVSPMRRRNLALIALSGTLLLGMFSIASAANRDKGAPIPEDTIAESQMTALKTDDEASLAALEQLCATNPRNGIYSYLIAAHHARHKEWEPAINAMNCGNEAPDLVLAQSVTGRGGYPALSVLRQLVRDVAEEASQRDGDEIQEQLLRNTGILANRLARDAMPCDIPVLQSAAHVWQVIEHARITAWEREERFSEVSSARIRLANRIEWAKQVNTQRIYIDASDESVRVAVAEQLRAHLPR